MTKAAYSPALLLDFSGSQPEVVYHDPVESGTGDDNQLRFVVGMTAWLCGLADVAWPADPADSLWNLLLEPGKQGDRRIVKEWLSFGKFPGRFEIWLAVCDQAGRVLYGEAPAHGGGCYGSYDELLEAEAAQGHDQDPGPGNRHH